MYSDSNGTSAVAIIGWGLKIAGLLSLADGPFPIGELIGMVVLGVTAILATGAIIYENADTIKDSLSKAVDYVQEAQLAMLLYLSSRIIREVDGRDNHHIVAKKAWRALPSRIILDKVGIGVNSPQNLVSVRRPLHWVLHTKTYYATVNTSLSIAYLVDGKRGVENTLTAYRVILGG